MPKNSINFVVFMLCLVVFSSVTSLSVSADDGQQTPPPPPPETSSVHLDQPSDADQMVSAAGVGCGGETYGAYDAGFEQAIVEMVNDLRAEEGLPPLKLINDLTNAARYHARDMAEDQYFNHHTHDWVEGELMQACIWSDRIRNYYTNWGALGENIARGYTTPEGVMEGWIRSEGHHENMLDDYREIGIGYYHLYWVQNFGARGDVYPIIINGEKASTADRQVSIYAYGEWEEVRFRNDDGSWSEWQAFANDNTWALPDANGIHRVDAQLKRGNEIVTSSDTIEYVNAQAAEEDAPDMDGVAPAMFLPLVTR